MSSRAIAIAAAAGALAVLAPTVAHAGTVALDRSCAVQSTQMTVTGSGFRPGSLLNVTGASAPMTVTADAAGGFSVRVDVPDNPSDGAMAATITAGTLAVDDATDPAQRATVPFRVVNHAFQTSGGTRRPTARRTWWFSGFTPGATIYGHFRHRGKVRGTFRFGRAKGPCGLLKRRAPGIPVPRSRIRSGKWTLQVDESRRYRRSTTSALVGTTTVFPTRR